MLRYPAVLSFKRFNLVHVPPARENKKDDGSRSLESAQHLRFYPVSMTALTIYWEPTRDLAARAFSGTDLNT